VNNSKTVIQCDFDGTITDEDVSYKMLEAYAEDKWHKIRDDYHAGKISVGVFNTSAFAMVKAGKNKLLEVARNTMQLRPGLPELVECCRRKGFRFTIISNGLDFYIEDMMKNIGLDNLEIHAATTRFFSGGLEAQYIGPGGEVLDNGLKETYVDFFLAEGYRVIYMGNGVSDIPSAVKCHHIFATEELLSYCEKHPELNYTPLNDFGKAAEILEKSF
jgi:2-hydroxy-3-keto-5-methylthiopentenyl-1-phosphate phosphatase